MSNKFRIGFILVVLIAGNLHAQTSQWRLIWSENTEADMSHYLVFRGTAPSPTSQIANVSHPDTVYTDKSLSRGVRYYYRLKAVDLSLLESDYSEEVSAAIPLISSFPGAMNLPTDTTISLSLNNYVNDPDDPDAQLVWTAQGQSQIQVTINSSTHVASIKTPLSWSGTETIQFRVQDPDGFFDLKSLQITVSRRRPQFSAIPDVSLNEDGAAQVDLATYVTDKDTPKANLVYSVTPAANLQLTFNKSILTIKPEANWNGSRTITVYVTDESALSDTTTIKVTVNAVADRPQFTSIPAQSINEDGSKQVDLKNYVQDVDTPVNNLTYSVDANAPLQLVISGSVLTITPPLDWTGERTLTVYVRDASNLTDTTTIVVTVSPVSDRPQFSAIPQQTISEDSSGQIDLKNHVQDVDTPVGNLIFSVAANPPLQLAVNGSMLTFTPPADWYGERTLTVYVRDPGNLSDTTTLLVRVNPVADPPQFLTIPGQAMIEDNIKQLDLIDYVQDVDTPLGNLVFAVAPGAPFQLTINSSVLTITPPADWSGERTIIVFVTDNSALSDTTQFLLTVVTSADAPVFSAIAPVSISEDHSKQINLSTYVTDGDSPTDKLTFRAAPALNLQITIQGNLMNIIPQANWFGNRDVTVYVTDDTDLSDTVKVAVNVKSVNDLPVMQPLAQVSLQQEESTTIGLGSYVSDLDHNSQQLTWQFSNYFHIEIEYNKTAQSLKIISPADWEGFEYVRATVTDDSGGADTDTMLVHVIGVAQAPELSAFPQIQFNEDGSTSLNINNLVLDPDTPDQNLFWSVHGNTSVSASFNTMEGTADFSSKANWNGTEEFWLIVTDPTELKDSVQVSVAVTAVNDPPQFAGMPGVDLSGQSSQSVNLAAYTTDVDHADNLLQWSYSGNNKVQVSLDASGMITFSAAASWKGLENIRVFVHDPADALDSSSIMVYSQDLTKAPQISAISPVTINEDDQKTIELAALVADPDNTDDQLVWQVADTQNVNAVFDAFGQSLLLQPDADWFGQEKITLQVTDPDGNFDYATLEITVLPINDAPKILPIGTLTLYGSTVYVLNLKDYIIEPDGLSDISSLELIAGDSGFIGYALDKVNFLLIFFTPVGFTGVQTYWLRITDKGFKTAQAIFSVQVYRDNLTSKIRINSFGASTTVIFEWNTYNLSKSSIEYGTSAAYSDHTLEETGFESSHQHILDGLQENQTYHFRIVSSDINGRLSYTQDSTFTTGKASAEVNVFPIPYRASDEENLGGVHFTNMPEGAELIIFSLLGEPVFKKNNLGSIYRWSAVNNAGRGVASGIYLYVVKDAQHKKVSGGKLIVVR